MKVQWQLINVETKEVIASIGEPFDLSENLLKEGWEKQIRGVSPIKTALDAIKFCEDKEKK
jgi:hypothetical protein